MKGFVIISYILGINVKSNFSSPVLSKAYDQPPVSGKQIDRQIYTRKLDKSVQNFDPVTFR